MKNSDNLRGGGFFWLTLYIPYRPTTDRRSNTVVLGMVG